MSLVEIVCYVTILATLVQIYYWVVGFRPLVSSQTTLTTATNCTILICAHNELANLKRTLPTVLDSIELPLIVIDHGSTDGSIHYLSQLEKDEDQLQVFYTERIQASKKEALRFGIAKITTDMVLLTDADCTPLGYNWPNAMATAMGDASICIGVSPLTGGPTIVAGFAEWDSIHTALSMIYRTRIGKPFMAVGRNIMVRKDALDVALSRDQTGLPGGDDDLLIQHLRSDHDIAVCTDPRGFTTSKPPQVLSSLLHKRRRHLSTSIHYGIDDKVYLLMLSSSHWLHYFGILLLLLSGHLIPAIILWAIRIIIVLAKYQRKLSRMHEDMSLAKIAFYDACYLLFYPVVFFLMQAKPKKEW